MEQTPQTRLMISAWVISALPGRRHTNGWCILHKAIVSWEQTSTSNQQPKRLFSWGWNCPYKSVCQVHVCSSSDTYFAMEYCSTRCKCGLIPIRFSRENKAFGPFSHCTIWHHLFNSCSDPLRLRWAIFQSPQRLAIWSDWLSCSLKKNTVFTNHWNCQPGSFSSPHKSLIQVCVHLKSDCLQLSAATPYGSCIYGAMRPAPGVQSGHYLRDAAAPVVKVTWYTPDWRIANV